MGHRIIDLETWDRKRLFDFYEDFDMPYIIITAAVDVTRALSFSKKNGISFNLVMVYLSNKVADSIVNFRYRFEGRKVFLIDHNMPEINHLVPGADLFVAASGPWPCDDIVRFCKETHAKFAEMNEGSFVDAVEGRNDIINYSSIPWIEYTHMFRTIKKGGQDNNPKITFGKYSKDNGVVKMPVSVQVHHALADGVHVGKFYTGLQDAVLGLPE